MMMVTWENYEEYLLLHVDGELSDAEQKALLGFIALHPEVEDELKLYQSTVLQADTTVAYSPKEALLKSTPIVKTIALGQWWKYGVAAGVILIVSVVAFRWISGDNGDATKSMEVATAQAAESRAVTPGTVQQQARANILEPSHAFSHKEKNTSVAKNSVHSNTRRIVKELTHEKVKLQTITPIRNEIAVEMTPPPAELLPTAENKAIAEPSAVQPRSNSNLFAWLPEEKKEGLELLKENVDQKVGKANQIRENIKDTQLAFKLGNKELVVINF
jgi:hypothetical protein